MKFKHKDHEFETDNPIYVLRNKYLVTDPYWRRGIDVPRIFYVCEVCKEEVELRRTPYTACYNDKERLLKWFKETFPNGRVEMWKNI